MSVRWAAAGASDVGRVRKTNEDTFLVDSDRGLFLVADGMGGHAAGEIASAMAAEVVGSALASAVDRALDSAGLDKVILDSFQAAHRAITDHSLSEPLTRGMGTTLTACVLARDGTYRLGHMGDSRAYRVRDGKLGQITRDHTWVQQEVEAGRLTPSGARTHRFSHVITRALGADSHDDTDIVDGTLVPGDLLLLCTDGLTGMVSDSRMNKMLVGDAPLETLLADLIHAANARGGTDNITAVLVRVLEG